MAGGKDKSPYARLNDYNLAGSIDSRSASPSSQFPADDQHFAYSTSLRRSEPDISHAVSSLASSRYNYEPSNPNGIPTHHHPFAHTTSPLTPSSHYATQTVQQTLATLSTSANLGLSSSSVAAVREISGPNEFQVPAKPPLWKRFASQFYESPLILLLLGSAGVSALVGNYDDAASIIAAIVIVVTGKLYFLILLLAYTQILFWIPL